MMLANLYWSIVQSTWFWLLTSLKMISASRLRNVNTVLLTSVVTKIDHSEMPFRQYRLREIFGRKYEERGQLCTSDANYVFNSAAMFTDLETGPRRRGWNFYQTWFQTFTWHGFKLQDEGDHENCLHCKQAGHHQQYSPEKNTQLLSRCWTKCKNVPFGQYLSK